MATETLSRGALPRLQWSPVITGVLCALAVHIVLGLFGTAFGLAAAPADSRTLGFAAGIWSLLVPFISSGIGAFVCVRIAREYEEAGCYLHGALVWCIALIAGAVFITGSLASGAMSPVTAVRPGIVGREVSMDDAQRAAAAMAGAGGLGALLGLAGAFLGAFGARRALLADRLVEHRLRVDESARTVRTETMPSPRMPATPTTGDVRPGEVRPGEDPSLRH